MHAGSAVVFVAIVIILNLPYLAEAAVDWDCRCHDERREGSEGSSQSIDAIGSVEGLNGRLLVEAV